MRWLGRQALDALAYWLLPFVCFLLPARPSNALTRFVAGRAWFFRGPTANALSNVQAVTEVADPEAWKTTFRLVHFLDAVDIWHGRFSSDRRIARRLVIGPEHWPEPRRRVFLGTHLGPSTLMLRCIAAAGLKPTLVYRTAQADLVRRAPVLHAYQRWRIAYIRSVCEGREVGVPGGREALGRVLESPECALILLVDAPAGRDQGVTLDLCGGRLSVDPRGLAMAVERRLDGVPWVMVWDAKAGRRRIVLGEERALVDTNEALGAMNDWLGEWVARDSAQWQLWLTAVPVVASATAEEDAVA